MKFSPGALVVVLSATPLISGFIPSTNVLVKQGQTTSTFGVISSKIPSENRKHESRHYNSKLFMSEESVAVSEESSSATEEVPAEIAAIDGIADETEAHNVERPARGSGIKKHAKSEKSGKALSEFSVGESVEGTVKATTSYGAFLNIGATTDALLHVSRMSDDFVSNVEDIVKVGDVVTVRILKIDEDKNQVALTMRSEEVEKAAASGAQEGRGGGGARRQRPRRSDGDREAQRESMSKLAAGGFSDDKFIEGEVVSMLDFGAFVRFDSSQFGDNFSGEIDGLVHISALTPNRVESVQSIVSVGEKVQIRVKNVDAQNGKVSLSMINKEDEKSSPGRQERKGRRGPWSEKEMGPKDWKEQMDRVLSDQGEFKNLPLFVDKRK